MYSGTEGVESREVDFLVDVDAQHLELLRALGRRDDERRRGGGQDQRPHAKASSTQRFFAVLRPAFLRAVFSAFEVFARSARWARSCVWMSLKRPLASRTA